MGLIATLDARDRYTSWPSPPPSLFYARDIAERMALDPKISKALLTYADWYTTSERLGCRRACSKNPAPSLSTSGERCSATLRLASEILGNVDTYSEIAGIVRHHHERVDGQGYPDGVAGVAIPLLSRIIAVADAYNAMTSDRPYRDAMPSRVLGCAWLRRSRRNSIRPW